MDRTLDSKPSCRTGSVATSENRRSRKELHELSLRSQTFLASKIQCWPSPMRMVPLSRSLSRFSPSHCGLVASSPASTFHARPPSIYSAPPLRLGSTRTPTTTLATSSAVFAGRPACSHVGSIAVVRRVSERMSTSISTRPTQITHLVIQGQIAFVRIENGGFTSSLQYVSMEIDPLYPCTRYTP